jgi:PAS domain S-box-containing protein
MAHDEHHEHLLKELTEQLEPIFSNSPQAIYLYLDETHKSCNKKFADMLGYSSPEDWVTHEDTIADVVEEDQQKGINAYVNASEKLKSSTLDATWISKKGERIQTEVTMVPLPYKNEVFVLHFITKK